MKNNFNMSCSEFKTYAKSNEKLLKAVKSAEKYSFK